LVFLLAQGGLLALALAWCGAFSAGRLLAWGLAGGLMSFGLDFLITWRWLGYKGIWSFSYYLNEAGGTEAAQTAYGLLQIARFSGPCLVLGAIALRREPREKVAWMILATLAAAAGLQYFVRGGGFRLENMSFLSTGAYLGSVWLVLAGLCVQGRGRENVDRA
jgi:hypothetical protein